MLQVVLHLGELDCREHLAGLPEPEPKAAQLVSILLDTAASLARDRGFRVALHPVAPLLEHSHEAARAFNAELQSKVSLAEAAISAQMCEA